MAEPHPLVNELLALAGNGDPAPWPRALARRAAEMLAPSTEITQNHVDVLDAVRWWVRGFNAASGCGGSSAPNIIALEELLSVLERIIAARRP